MVTFFDQFGTPPLSLQKGGPKRPFEALPGPFSAPLENTETSPESGGLLRGWMRIFLESGGVLRGRMCIFLESGGLLGGWMCICLESGGVLRGRMCIFLESGGLLRGWMCIFLESGGLLRGRMCIFLESAKMDQFGTPKIDTARTSKS